MSEPLGAHWDRVYDSRRSTELSWYQRDPVMSLRLIEATPSGQSPAVIDVGSGASELVDRLLARGYTDITLMDVSRRALRQVRDRLGDTASDVTFLEQDVLTWTPDRRYDLWHDRAVFHFLVERADRERYVDVAGEAIRSGGHLVLATFGPDGPTSCSGLPVCRYSATELDDAFAGSFSPVEAEREEHLTPTRAVQAFTWVVLRRA